MQQAQADIQQQNPQQFLLSGTVDFSTVPSLLQRATSMLSRAGASGTSICLDWSAVEACNSAALALLLELYRQAKQQNLSLQASNLPENLLSIARAYGVEDAIREISQ